MPSVLFRQIHLLFQKVLYLEYINLMHITINSLELVSLLVMKNSF